jgi:hypothetical protein
MFRERLARTSIDPGNERQSYPYRFETREVGTLSSSSTRELIDRRVGIVLNPAVAIGCPTPFEMISTPESLSAE